MSISSSNENQLTLLLKQIRYEAKNINSYEFVDPDGNELPGFTAGSHIDVCIGPGLTRQYSLSNDPCETHRYVVTVLKDESGKGGSKALHQNLKAGDMIQVSAPRNHFELDASCKKALLLAGGIGVTPIKSMAHQLMAQGIPFDLHYCAKDPSYAAYVDELQSFSNETNSVYFHYDQAENSSRLDIAELLKEQAVDQQLYFCGPPGFMKACKEGSIHWAQGSVHFEHFQAPVIEKAANTTSSGDYIIVLGKSGAEISVSGGASVLEVLSENGIEVSRSCESGLCGACRVSYSEGEIDHQDFILSDDEKNCEFTACVSKVISPRVVLDL